MNNPYANIPLNQPNREELIRVLEAIRIDHLEDWQRNVRECGETITAIRDEFDIAWRPDGSWAFSVYPTFIRCYSSIDSGIGPIAIFRIKTRKP